LFDFGECFGEDQAEKNFTQANEIIENFCRRFFLTLSSSSVLSSDSNIVLTSGLYD
jgi:hypothetical protein